MPDSILDIVQRLSFEVNAKGLTDISNALTKQVQITNNLLDLNKKYSDQLKTTNDPAKIQQLTTSLNANNKALEAQGTAIKGIINNNPKLKEVYNQEITVIQTLSQKLTELKRQRDLATDPAAYANITAQIKKAQADVNGTAAGAVGGGAGGGQSSGLLGVLGFNNGQSVGRQILTGSLLGVGFGGGLGLITRLTSGLVEFAEAEFDATAKAEKLKKAQEDIVAIFDKEAQDLEKLNQQFRYIDVGIDGTTDALKRQEEAIKAQGVVNRDAFAAAQRDLAAGQKTRDSERKDIDVSIDTYTKLRDVVDEAARAVHTNKDFKDLTELVGTDNKERIQNVFNNAPSDVPKQTLNNLLLGLEKASKERGTLGLGGDEVQKSLFKSRDEFDKKIQELNKVAADKDAEANTAKIADATKTRMGLDELQHQQYLDHEASLAKQFEADQKYKEDVLKLQIQTDAIINDQFNKQQNIVNAAYDKSIKDIFEKQKEAENKYGKPLRTDVISGFNNERADAASTRNSSSNEITIQRQEALRKYYEQQELIRQAFQLKEDDASVEYDKDQLLRLSAFTDEYYDQIVTLNAAILKSQKDRADAEYENATKEDFRLLKQLEDAGEQQTTLYKEIEDRLARQGAIHVDKVATITAQSDTTNYNTPNVDTTDFEKKQQVQTNNALIASDADTSESIEKLSSTFKSSNVLNPIQQYRLLITQLEGKLTDLKTQYSGTSDSLNKAIKNADIATSVNNTVQTKPDSTDAQKLSAQTSADAAIAEVNRLRKALADLGIDIKKTTDAETDALKKKIADYIGLAEDLVSTIQSAYDSIAEAQQKSLDREISVRTQRVDAAQKLAERGNTQALADEQKKLDAAEKQRRDAALREEEINAALVVSNALLAVAKAAVEGGGFGSIAAIAAVIAALGVGFAEAEKLSAESKSSFATGVVGYRGRGTGTSDENPVWISNGESVITAAGTRKHAPLLKAINAGEMLPTFTAIPAHYTHVSTNTANGVNKSDFEALGARVDKVAEAVGNIHFVAKQDINHRGVRQMVETSAREQKSNWK